MSGAFPGGSRVPAPDRERIEHVDATLERRTERQRWEARAAEWRALEIARWAFGDAVRPRLTGRAGGEPFRGLLHLEVPFADLDDHRLREAAFLRAAGGDAVLAQVPFVFVFSPVMG